MQLEVIKEKAATVKDMSEDREIKSLCNIIIMLVGELETKEKELGFKK